ncbi:phosphoribosylglycinamide formyltransferase 2 [Streptomyces sulfonofaciens]|uniref:Phosphoribosylglycinamide formyltransferase 2 n=1 Tax=Streptomyces sulfonofaciens TaxID=68272 RepID=A0A919G2A8_9ACTN|nr:hypothetical protein [Streptomyces sulfonofaciens]GHH76882.1 phosphoribosylglycinamide formyltransferase 2 [Streptomyces sulfonofaciens]
MSGVTGTGPARPPHRSERRPAAAGHPAESPPGRPAPVRAVRFGSFDAERHWRPADLANLPRLTSPGTESLIAGLDETLAAASGPDDLLITRNPLGRAHVDALGAAGITFRHATAGGGPAGDLPGGGAHPRGADPVPEGVEEALLHDRALQAAIARAEALRPFAVLEATSRLTHQPDMPHALPDYDTVVEVNGKAWSSALADRLGLPGAGTVVRSAAELQETVTALAAAADAEPVVLVKDPYGVAGRGTIELSTPGSLARLVRRLRAQEEQGLRVELLVQRRYARAHDFSGHLTVAPDGTWSLLGIQSMTNDGYRYGVSRPAPQDLVEDLDRRGYPDILEATALALAQAGYSGPACVDSMTLRDGGWVPVLEINARMSMGLLTLELDRRARRSGLHAHLWQHDVTIAGDADIDTLLSALDREGLLWRGGARPGVLPLAGGTLCAPRGRLVCAAFCAAEDFPAWRDRTEQCARGIGVGTLPPTARKAVA